MQKFMLYVVNPMPSPPRRRLRSRYTGRQLNGYIIGNKVTPLTGRELKNLHCKLYTYTSEFNIESTIITML